MTAILIGGEKGGTGKSTIATNLAIMASIMGKDVLLLDCDKQATSAKFISKRHNKKFRPTPACVQAKGENLNHDIDDLNKRYEIIIIDAGGRDSMELRASMCCNSVTKLYTPIQPSEFDLDTMAKMDELVSLARSYNAKLQSYLIFNQSPTHSKVTLIEDAYNFVKDLDYFKVLGEKISHRIPFQYGASESLSVVEFELDRVRAMPKYQADKYIPKASIEISALYKHVFEENFEWEINHYFGSRIKANIQEA